MIALLAIDSALAQGAPVIPGPPITKFGILYNTWHCLVTKAGTGRPFSVVADALAGRRPWGPVPEFHYWAEPRAGFYCLSDRSDVLALHAGLLRDAGIDFIVVDASNNEYTDSRSPDSAVAIVEPYQRLLEVWSGVPNAPKIVPWAPLTEQGNMLEWMTAQLTQHPALQFAFRGKPLALIVDHIGYTTSAAKEQQLERSYTVRRMWGLEPSDGGKWSFLSLCQPGFLMAKARIPCRQQMAMQDGRPEQLSIAAAYQETYMSYKVTAVPKFQGRTFVRQFETAATVADLPVALITGWNEWMAQRFCLDGRSGATELNCTTGNDHWPDGSKIFVDQYDAEYNRDIEPSRSPPGDYYYRLMKHCIVRYRDRRPCNQTEVIAPVMER
jgi:hypothetical protein